MRVRPSQFKYYIHDSVDVCRLQLLGELSEHEVRDLNGCWKTARTTLDGRKLVVDIRGLRSADQAGRDWLQAMIAEGASLLEGPASAPSHPPRPNLLRRLLSVFPRLAQSPTQAQ